MEKNAYVDSCCVKNQMFLDEFSTSYITLFK